ncbi:MAG: hypothetical protein LC772_11570 [Chloroflexi bacterium]|nr:hypothetical protein [Chloroflexota bacterium]
MSECLCGSFVVERLLGDSAAGQVFRGRHASSGQAAWVYTLSESSRENERATREFQRRRNVAATLGEHPRAWRFLESGSQGQMLYYAVSETGGAQLARHAARARTRHAAELSASAPAKFALDESRQSGRTPAFRPPAALPPTVPGVAIPGVTPWTVRTWLSDLLSAVSFAHQRGIFLGNLSPYNVWINLDGSASLVDTGSGTLLDCPTPASTVTNAGGAGRRSDYLAPEQVLGWTVGPGADIYAVGAILFWLLGGVFPPHGRGDGAQIGRMSGRKP